MKKSNKNKDVMIRVRVDRHMQFKIDKMCEEIEETRSDFIRRCLSIYIDATEMQLNLAGQNLLTEG